MPTIRMNREQMQGGYTVLPNQILRTREMSYKARYLLAQMAAGEKTSLDLSAFRYDRFHPVI